MARTIESPGVEINEIDLSLRASLPVGTNVFVQGFADSGPTDELINVTSVTELEQIYGIPTNAAERYFYHTAKQVLESPGNLLTNRMPYGLSGGGGYGAEYTALIFPVNTYEISEVDAISSITVVDEYFHEVTSTGLIYNVDLVIPTLIAGTSAVDLTEITIDGTFSSISATLVLEQVSPNTLSAAGLPISGSFVNNISSFGITLDFTNEGNSWPGDDGLIAGTKLYASYEYEFMSLSGEYTLSPSISSATKYEIGEPTLIELTDEQYLDWESGKLEALWSQTPNSAGSPIDSENIGNAGLIFINQIKTSVDNRFGGYYLALKDNTDLGDTIYNSFDGFRYDRDGSWRAVVPSMIETRLTGDETNNSVSEVVETIADAYGDFDSTQYDDCLMVGLFRLRQSATTQSAGLQLQAIARESHLGSLDSTRIETPAGQPVSFNLQEVVDGDSIFMRMKVNPHLSTQTTWEITGGKKKVRTSSIDKLYSIGSFLDVTAGNKYIGNLPEKLARSLRLAENRDQIPIDIVVDGGLSTIHTAAMSDLSDANDCKEYNDKQYLYGIFEDDNSGGYSLIDQDNGSASTIQNNWSVIFDRLNTFCQSTRKDCLFISDAIKHIFVQGDLKTLQDSKKNFSAHIYWALKNLFGASNSNFACTYGNWVKVYDDYLGAHTWLPFSGFEANIMCKMDAALQPWYAPAGLNNGIIRGISDIALNPTQKQRDLLYRISVNPVVYFPGDGYTVWGQKTLQKKPSAFDRINVRRLFITIAKAANAVLRYFVFEPNTVFTRTRVVNILSPIMEITKNNEGTYDYLIICDERNNTPEVIDANELRCSIYIKPVRTAEFISLDLIATRTDQDFTELI